VGSPDPGLFGGRDGRGPWELKDPEAFIQRTMARHAGVDIPLDYEHQSVMAEENGQPAPAAGWIKALASRADGIWDRVEWTQRGASLVVAREYRYISPFFIYDDKSGVLTQLESAALVAQPNLQLTALNKSRPSLQGANIDEFLKQLPHGAKQS
jgi:phage I-like protein